MDWNKKNFDNIFRLTEQEEKLNSLYFLGANDYLLNIIIPEYVKTHSISTEDLCITLQSASQKGVDLSMINTVNDIDKAIWSANALILTQQTTILKRSMLASKPIKYLYAFAEWLVDKLEMIIKWFTK